MIHYALISTQCPALDHFVNGAFTEAKESHAHLDMEAVSEETFVLFTQFAYTGDYHPRDAPYKTTIVEWPAETLPSPTDEMGPSGLFGTKKIRCSTCSTYRAELKELKATKKSSSTLWADFGKAASPTSLKSEAGRLGTSRPSSNALLSHARLYVFADCYGIPRLEELSFHKLTQELVHLTLEEKGTRDFLETLEYSLDEPAPHKLQNHIIMYAACKISVLWKNTKFQDLMVSHRELAIGLMGHVVQLIG